ncbi:hypothetical protein [Rhodococcus jostii]|uniref:hypothetical protein n=1 Tax=Rhodococcus jostii TaxID=132919 RepID=UPI00362D8693
MGVETPARRTTPAFGAPHQAFWGNRSGHHYHPIRATMRVPQYFRQLGSTATLHRKLTGCPIAAQLEQSAVPVEQVGYRHFLLLAAAATIRQESVGNEPTSNSAILD